MRRGAGRGTGKGYRNLRGFPKDPMVHSQSARGIKQPQMLTRKKRLTALRSFERGTAYKFPRGEKVYKVGDVVLKIQKKEPKFLSSDKDDHPDEQSVRKRCRIFKLIKKQFPYYPECQIAETNDNIIMITQFEGKSLYDLGGDVQGLSKAQKQQLEDVIHYLLENDYINWDVNARNVSLDKKGNAIIIDMGMTHKIRKGDFISYMTLINNIYNYIFKDENKKIAENMLLFGNRYKKNLGGKFRIEKKSLGGNIRRYEIESRSYYGRSLGIFDAKTLNTIKKKIASQRLYVHKPIYVTLTNREAYRLIKAIAKE